MAENRFHTGISFKTILKTECGIFFSVSTALFPFSFSLVLKLKEGGRAQTSRGWRQPRTRIPYAPSAHANVEYKKLKIV